MDCYDFFTTSFHFGLKYKIIMPTLRDILDSLSTLSDSAENWIEWDRDLREPIKTPPPGIEFTERWAQKKDIIVIAALEGFAKSIDFMRRSLKKGDQCLVLERENRICAFAWVTFRDYRLSFWRTLHLAPGYAYLVYIFVLPEFQRRGVGYYLLGSMMVQLRKLGCDHLISGTFEHWHKSVNLHRKAGFRIKRKFIKRRVLRILPCPPKKIDYT
jgi:GNAT superfamily N-acetyltransferase